MRPLRCARCGRAATFIVTAGTPDTFWYRTESTCLVCLPRSKRWAQFVGPVSVVPVGELGVFVQATLFDLPGEVRR
jgi:hypothetical protein